MFHRRRASSNPPRNNAPPPAAATLAASQAFLKNASSNASLSSAAAAAALRSHTTSPEPIGNLQTKRTARRGSLSSQAGNGVGRGTLQRNNSSGSMTERTFRTDSPRNTPPVPAIPQHVRASSVEPPPLRVNSPTARGGRGVSVDRGTRRASAQPYGTRANGLSEVSELERDGSQPSVNFSYPRVNQASPPPSPRISSGRTGYSGWYTEPIASGAAPRADLTARAPQSNTLPPNEVSSIQQAIQDAANKPMGKKKQKAVSGEPGSHLATGSMVAKPTGTAIQGDSTESHGHAAPSANTGRKLETDQGARIPNRVASTSVAPAKSSAPPLQRQRSSSLTVPARSFAQSDARGTGRTERAMSLSPSRSTHFAAAPELLSGIKHQPPPRSLSPAKSALKHSPSSSARNGSPVPNFATGKPRAPPSDVSDTMSDDGARPKKKKGARVSFDEDTVGPDRGDDSPTSSRGGGMESSRWSGTTAAANEQDYGLKPMPALPSFGSIRSQRRQEEPEMIEKVTETAPSSMSTSISTLAEPMGPSSDHAVGGIFARDYATKQATESKRRSAEPANAVSNNPAPATTSSSSSTFDSDQSRDNTGSKPSPQVEPQRSSSVSSHTLAFAASIVGGAESNPSHDDGIPSISLEPPTPKAEEYEEAPDYVMPGGWDEDAFHRARTGPVETQQWIAEPTAEPKSSTETAAEPVAVEAAPVAVTDVPPIARPQRGRQLTAVTEEESSDDDDSIYSDAEENLDEDDRGFSSLNAIANSPIGPSSPRMAVATLPDSPVVAAPPQQGRLSNWLPSQSVESSPSDTAEDWNQSRAYWSSLNEQRKQQLEQEALTASSPSVQPALSEPAPSEPTQALPAPKPKKKINAVPQQVPPAPLGASKASAPRSQQPSQPKAPAMRQSLRAPFEPTAAEQPATHMRKSMRGDDAARTMRGGNTMRTSMRSVEPESARPASPLAQPPAARGALQKKNIPSAPTMRSIPPPQTATAAKNRASAMPALGRKMSDDSVASASSFRKQRRRTSDTGGAGGYTMKRSMRGSSQPAPIEQRPVSPTPPPTKSSRFSIRSLSPTGSFMRRPMTGSAIRASLDTGVPTLRPQSAKPEKASKISGFGKSSKPKAPAPKAASGYESRFGDSSDEDARPTFRSRFADSDDEDDAPVPTGLTPVRGIPRRAGDEDRESTDLSDEESDSGRRPKQHPPVPTSADVSQAASARPMTNGNPQGAALASGTLRDSSKPTAELPNGFPGTKPKPKRGFFGMGKKKPASEPLGRPITPIDAKQMADNAMAQSPSGAASPRSPRLHRRNTPTMQRMESDTWPLPAPPAIGGEERPATADGAPVVVKPQRPEIGTRRSTYDEKGNVLGRSGKKKKFQFLRRAFRLDD